VRLRRRGQGKRGARACVLAGTRAAASMPCSGDSRGVVLRDTRPAVAVGSARSPFDEMCHRPPATGGGVVARPRKAKLIISSTKVERAAGC